MSRRTQRIGNLIRQTLGQALLSKLSDPRLDSVRTSITRVEVPEDLLTAKVFVSVMGTEAEQSRVIHALKHASGHLQELIGRQISLRHTPILSFEVDKQFKSTLETLDLIQRAMDEIDQRQRDRQAQAPQPAGAEDDHSGPAAPPPGPTNT